MVAAASCRVLGGQSWHLPLYSGQAEREHACGLDCIFELTSCHSVGLCKQHQRRRCCRSRGKPVSRAGSDRVNFSAAIHTERNADSDIRGLKGFHGTSEIADGDQGRDGQARKQERQLSLTVLPLDHEQLQLAAFDGKMLKWILQQKPEPGPVPACRTKRRLGFRTEVGPDPNIVDPSSVKLAGHSSRASALDFSMLQAVVIVCLAMDIPSSQIQAGCRSR